MGAVLAPVHYGHCAIRFYHDQVWTFAVKDTPAYLVGSAGLTSPWWAPWLDYLSYFWQGVVFVLGAFIMGLTLYNKILEMRQRRRDLKEG